MAYILSKGVKLGYSSSSAGSYTYLNDLVSVPSLGGDTDKVETTTLADGSRHYIDGLVDYGDLEFGFIYDNASASNQFDTLKALEDTDVYWQVQIPTATASTYKEFEFSGKPKVAMSAIEVGNRLEYTVKIFLSSDIELA